MHDLLVCSRECTLLISFLFEGFLSLDNLSHKLSFNLLLIFPGVQLVSWNIGSLRRYGVNNVCFTFDTGRFVPCANSTQICVHLHESNSLSILSSRNCSTGEGKFFFYSQHSRIINNRVHLVAQRLNKIKESRRASAVSGLH